nr:11922_t:CDS:2 [Entrophospora candida]
MITLIIMGTHKQEVAGKQKDGNNNDIVVGGEETSLWKIKDQFNSDLDLDLKINEYRTIIKKLNELDKISTINNITSLKEFLSLFKRHDFEKEKKLVIEKKNKLDLWGRSFSVGKRKTSSAKIWLIKGDGLVYVNGVPMTNYFQLLKDRNSILFPFKVTDLIGKYNVWAIVRGGGHTGQSEAIAHGITKSLLVHDPSLKPILRKAKLVTRDRRSVERKKPGKAKARKSYTWVKR